MGTVARFRRQQAGEALCLIVAGDLDISNVELFACLLRTVLDESERVEVDLEDVSFLSSDAIGALLVASELARARRVDLSVVASPSVRRLLEVTGLDSLLAVCI